MSQRTIRLLVLMLSCCLLYGCAILGIVEVESVAIAAEGAEAAAISGETLTMTEVGGTASTITFAEEAAPIVEFRTIIRSDLEADAYSLLKKHLPSAEMDVIDGIVRDEGTINSLLSRVRVAKVGTAFPRLYVTVAEGEAVEFAEVTSNRT
ncbi:MAG TPA: hypothetical protein VHS53_10680, partial [Mucilaginibacter sp.]|nr:hypothetical protein [Mucilaginibacter sp.]